MQLKKIVLIFLPDFHWNIAGFPRDFRETDENVIEMAVGVIIGGLDFSDLNRTM